MKTESLPKQSPKENSTKSTYHLSLWFLVLITLVPANPHAQSLSIRLETSSAVFESRLNHFKFSLGLLFSALLSLMTANSPSWFVLDQSESVYEQSPNKESTTPNSSLFSLAPFSLIASNSYSQCLSLEPKSASEIENTAQINA